MVKKLGFMVKYLQPLTPNFAFPCLVISQSNSPKTICPIIISCQRGKKAGYGFMELVGYPGRFSHIHYYQRKTKRQLQKEMKNFFKH